MSHVTVIYNFEKKTNHGIQFRTDVLQQILRWVIHSNCHSALVWRSPACFKWLPAFVRILRQTVKLRHENKLRE